MEEINKIYKLKDGHYFEMFNSDDGYYYSICDQTGKEIDGGLLKVSYPEEVASVTPGQACVLYLGEECMGSGIIKEVRKKGEKLWYL